MKLFAAFIFLFGVCFSQFAQAAGGISQTTRFGTYHMEPSNNPVGNCGAASTVDLGLGNVASITLNAATCTLTFTNPQPYGVYLFKLLEDATGSRAVTWPGTVKWAAGTTPTLSAANKTDIVWCLWDGTNYFCNPTLNF